MHITPILRTLAAMTILLFLASCDEDPDPTPCTSQTWYQDADSDGLGNPDIQLSDCEQPTGYVSNADDPDDTANNNLSAVERTFGDALELDNLPNYANQTVPNYINQDNTGSNPISDAGATLGRVLFYDRALSYDYSTACADCHQQDFAFSDPDVLSEGANDFTGRHSMRLVNARFGEETRFFWDERAVTLEEQSTMPIRDHAEMGFSGENGDPDFIDLIDRLEATDYYQELFEFVYGDATITEGRIQLALAQFVRSLQSFDSRYDAAVAQAPNPIAPFPTFTAQENLGKQLFTAPPQFDNNGNRIDGGLGCQGCHRAPEFDIDPNSQNNGLITVAGTPGATDLTITRSPSLRELFQSDGTENGPFMHDGSLATLDEVLDHYNDITFDPVQNPNLDVRLRGGNPNGPGQNLQLTTEEREAVLAFLQTLAGELIYTDEKWSDPFPE